jgi:hypothetical protein
MSSETEVLSMRASDVPAVDRVNAFYRSLRFTLRRTFVMPEGRAMNEYLLRLREG